MGKISQIVQADQIRPNPMTWGNFVMRHLIYAIPFAVTLGLAGAAGAEVTERFNAGSLSFSGGNGYTNAVLTISGPDDFTAEVTSDKGLPVFRVQTAGKLEDGFYQYSLVAASPETVKVNTSVNNGRGDSSRETANVPFSTSGMFQIADGSIVIQPEVRGGGDTDPIVKE